MAVNYLVKTMLCERFKRIILISDRKGIRHSLTSPLDASYGLRQPFRIANGI